MATSNFGKLCDYDNNKEDWQSYVERLELFLRQTALPIRKKIYSLNILWDRNAPII